MIINNFCPDDCPVDCGDTLFAVPTFPACETANDNYITEVRLGKVALEAGDLEEWDERLDNTSVVNNTFIRSIGGLRATLPRAEPVFKETLRGTRIPKETTYEISFPVEDDSDAAFGYWKKYECGVGVLLWYLSGGHTYGGLTGIAATLTATYEINPDGERAGHNWLVKLTWKAVCSPPRVATVA